jgi:import inner membrane translocase subunit TIM16
MTEQEARQILGVSENSTWEEIIQVCCFAYLKLSSHEDLYIQSANNHICYAALR